MQSVRFGLLCVGFLWLGAPCALAGIAQRVNDVVVLVLKDRQHRVRQRVDLEAVERQFVNRVLAARMHDDVELLQPLDTILDAA